MIDSHCHLEWTDFDKDLGKIIKELKKELKAVITVATEPKFFSRGLEIAEKNQGFIFLSAGIHPEFVKEISKEQIEKAFGWLRENERKLVGIGESGLDYFWVKEPGWREKQKELFEQSIALAKELDKVLVVHTREAHEDVIEILERNKAERVQLHMWGGNGFVKQIIDNGWSVSVGPVVKTSKKHQKVVRDLPIELLMLETDSPWFGGKTAEGKIIRGTPENIKIPAQEIAKIKEMELKEVWEACGKNAVKLFRLQLQKELGLG